ncbi:methylthioribose kinase-like [Ylistrum balloti]|uniref:methylthioribose kinase-like n=1 Tax=Ylistrum balloti TaxID=509963 RepID=UPI0029059BD2|nr:methylthioribose kinase-like [Ylistrum balloti]
MASVGKTVGDTDQFLRVVTNHSHLSDDLAFAREPGNLEVVAVGDGNLNDVVRVMEKQGNSSVIIKHAPPFIKCLGPEYPLTAERGTTEYQALMRFNTASPGCCPQTYFYDTEASLICMEDLRSYKDLRREMIQGVCSDEAVKCIAKHIAIVHRENHVSKLSSADMDDLINLFGYTDLVQLTEQYVFTRPFLKDDPTNKYSEEVGSRANLVYDNPQVLANAAKMKKVFLEKKECLIHGDLHTGSIMVYNDSAKLMDIEFAYVGPGAFDIGCLIANYIMSYYQHMSEGNRQFAYRTIDFCKLTGKTYFENMTCSTGDVESYNKNFMSEVAGFAGCEIIRRILGAAHVADLEGRLSAEVDALGAGVRLITAQERIDTMDQLMIIAHMLT